MSNPKRRNPRRFALLVAFALAVSVLPFDLPGLPLPEAEAGPPPIEVYLIPLPEEDIRAGSLALYSGTSDDVRTIISITGAVDGTIVYYDHWEDGFELDLSTPAQASTEIWGDGNAANGAPPGCSADVCDLFGAGDIAALINDVPANPRDPINVLYDGGDQVGATAPVAVTRAGWALNPGTVLAGAVEVYPTDAWSTAYTLPFGVDSTLGANYEYTAASIMASANGTTVTVDLDGDSVVDETHVVAAGESVLVPNLQQGATINSNGPIQVDLLTGDIGATYAGRWFALLPTSQWATSYFNPVGTVVGDDPATVALYNPGASTLTVDVTHQDGSTTVDVPAGEAVAYQMPGSGAEFSAGSAFYATVAVDYDGTTHDWGFTLVPETRLTTAAVVGWGPGSDDPANENSSPVWVTTEGATTLYVDYDGDPTTGSSQDANGDWYDTTISMTAYQMERLYDVSDDDQTGLKVYTLDGTRVAVAYGQDPSAASTGSPALDLGTAVVPLLLVAMGKIGSLSGDTNGNGALDPGEFITYTVTIRNDGTADINPSVFTDDLDPQTTYVPGTTTIDALPYADDGATPFPFDEGGQDLGLITAGQVVVITYDVQLNDPLPDGVNSIVNNAQLNSIGISITGTTIYPVFDPFLAVTKTSDVPAEGAIPGDTITYTILVENVSDTPQNGFTLSDTVPVETTYVAESTSVTGPVVVSDTYADDMESGGYGGSTGSLFWGPDWTEINESDGPSSGDERIVNSGGSLRLRVRDNDGNGEGVSRALNLGGYDSATVSFDFSRSGFDNANDFVVLEATDGIGPWTELAKWEGPGSDPVFLSTSYSLDAYLTAGAAIRFVTSQNLGGSDAFLIDNLVVTAETITSETRTNAPSDPTPLADGTAPDLLLPTDPFALAAGESMTVTYQVMLADPLIPSLTELHNVAYVASHQQPTFTTDDVTDPIAFPEVELAKNLLSNADEDASGDVSVGDTLTYQLVATNVGDTALSDVSITDPMSGLSPLSCSPVQPAALAMGQTLTCTATYSVVQADVNVSRIDNTASVTAVDPADRPVSDTASETVPINPVPAITVAKSLLTDLAGIGAGDTFAYEFVVTNTGNVDLSNVVVDDPLVGGAVSCPQTALSPNESMTCGAAYTVTQGDMDAGQVANTATVTADDPSDEPVTDDDDELAILEHNPSIDLAKDLLSNADEDGSGDTSFGDTLTYRFIATNDGNVTLNNAVVADPLPGLSALSCLPAAGASLAPNDQMTCTATYPVSQADIDAGSIDNTATVTGTSVSGDDVTDTASESVSAAQNPSITLGKSFAANADEDVSGDVTLNDTLTYQFDVVNDGNVTLTIVTITDPLPGLSSFACGPDVLPVTLSPMATVSCTATYVVTQPDVDAGRIDNTATATGQKPNGQPISDDDDETVLPDRNPSIDLAKTLLSNADEDASGDVSLGDTLTYQFVATNDGDVGLDNVAVTDPLPGMSALSCAPPAGSSLAPTEAMSCTATYTVTQPDVDAGEIVNTATASGDDSSGGGSVSDQDSVTTTTAQNPSITIIKSYLSNADEDASGDVSRNDTLTYQLTVENRGDVTLDNVAVDDPLTGGPVTCPQTTLIPGQSMVCTTTYVVAQSDIDAGSIGNTATVTAEDPDSNPVSDDDDELVSPPQNPSIVLVKSLLSNADEDGSGSLSTGDTITYQFVATNDGDVTLDLATITDPMPGLSALGCSPATGSSLATGASMTCTASYSVTQTDVDSGAIDNTATVAAERPGGDPGDSGDDVTDVDNHSVLIPAEPAIDLTKTVAGNADEDATGDVTVGDTLSYEFLVENTGNVTLSAVGVADPLIGAVVCPSTVLAPGDTTTCTGTHVVAQGDADAGFVINTATATGSDPNGTDVTDDDAVATPVVTGPAVTLVKDLLFNADEDGSGGVSIADTLTYRFVATNTGDVTLSAVRVLDPMAGLSALSCVPTQPAVLAPGESVTCTAIYSVTQTNVDQGQILNTATAEGLAPDASLVSDTDGETVLIAQAASISLDKFVAGNADEDGSGGITRDDTLTYQFEATNTGNVTLTGVNISDPLPGLGMFSCVPAQPTALLPGETIVCTADYVVTQTDVDNTQISNTATASGTDPDSANVTDDDSVVTPIEGGPAITLDKYLSGNADEDTTGDVSIGDTLTYQFDIENTGDTTLTDVRVTDPMPGLGAISCVPAQGSSLVPAATMSCSASYTVTVADAAFGQIDNTATAVGLAPAGTPTSDDDSETVLTARADLALFKSVSNPTPNVGDSVTFILSLVNDGPDTARNVGVTDVLPAGYTYEPGTIAGGDSQYDAAVPTLSWTVDSISSGTSVNLTFSALVAAPTGAPGEYRNVAEVSATDTFDPDSTPGNDDGDQSEDDEDNATVAPQSADLSLVKAVSDSTPNVGETVTFTITVSNAGPNDATGVAVEDVVPVGFGSITNISAGGSVAGSTATWASLAVAAGGSTALMFDAQVGAPPTDYFNVAQVIASDQLDPDSTPDNDDGDQSEDDEDGVDLVPQVADLSLVKVVSDATPNVGDTVTFTITVGNDGPDDATGVAVEDVVPAGYSGIGSVSGSGTVAGSTITWSGLVISAGGSVDLTFNALVDAPTGAGNEYRNVAQITGSATIDPDSTPNNDDGDQSEDDEDNAVVAPQGADLSLVKAVSDAAPNVGDVVTFTITVSNDGPDDATGVAVEDVVPAGFSNVAAISGGGVLGGSTITWSGLAVPAGGSVDLTFDIDVDAPTGTPGEYFNVAEVVGSDQFDPDSVPANDDGDQSEDDEDSAGVVPQSADLSLVKIVSDASPNVGDTVSFTITVSNDGPDDATGVVVEDVVPAGYSGMGSVSAGGVLGGSTITWSGLTVAAGGSVVLTFEAIVEAPPVDYVNVAEVTASDQHDPDSTPDNDDGDQSEDDEDNTSTTPQVADLSISKSVSDPGPNVGNTVTFTITVTNDGPAAATSVAVVDQLPGGFAYEAGSMAGGIAQDESASPTLTWTVGTLGSGNSVVLTFAAVVAAPSGAPGEYLNAAEVAASDQHDPDSTPNNDDGDQSEDDEDSAAVVPQSADLSLVKVVSDATPNVGDTVSFTITVSNDGPDDATDVAVEDVVPAGYSNIAAISAGGVLGGSTITWSGLSVVAGGSVDLTFEADVVAPPADYVNVAEVIASDQFDLDSSPNNDDGDQSEDDEDNASLTPVAADLSLVKAVSDATPNVGDTVTFTITVGNDGPDNATGVAVEDVVPAGFSNISAISGGGLLGGSTITWSGLAVPAGGSVDLTFDADVDVPTGTPGEYSNVAEVTASDQFDSDSSPNNDDGDQSEDDEDDAPVVPQQADLSLVKGVSHLTPLVGQTITFTLTVNNAGPADATGVGLRDLVPNGYGSIGSISDGGVAVGSTITWTGLTVPSGGSTSVSFDVTVLAPPAAFLNMAEVTASDQLDPDSTPDNDDGDQSEDDEDNVGLLPTTADLALVKNVSTVTPGVGDTVTFTITVGNDGPDDATGVAVEDVVPSGFSNIAAISGGGVLGGSTITWSGLAIPSGGSVDLTFDVDVNVPTGTPGEYSNAAEVIASDQHDPDSTPDNDDGDQSEDDEDNASLTPVVADLSLVKAVSDATPNVGDVVTFTITVSNDGPDDATGVAVEDVVPAGFSNVAAISGGGVLGGSTITWSGLAVPAGGSVDLTFDIDVDAPTGTPGEYFNVAEVVGSDQFDPDSVPANDDGDQSEDDEDSAGVVPQSADLSLVKIVSDASPNVGDTVSFTITVSNDGPDDATGVVVEDVVPAGYSGMGSVSAGGVLGGSTITWSGLTVAAGGSVVLTFEAIVEAPPVDYVNVAEVTASDQHDPDSTPDNDDGDQSEDDEDNTSTTPQVADLSISKSVSDPGPNVGDTVTFTVTVSNAGPDDASGVAVEDVVPAGYGAIDNVSSGGSAVGSTITWTGLTVATGGSVALTFDARVEAPPAGFDNVAEVTASDQHDPDSTPNNDDGDQSEDDEDNAPVIPQQADLSLIKTVSDSAPAVGATVTFTLTVTNDGPDDATDVAVEDVVPAGYSAISSVSSGGSEVGSTITWSGLAITAGSTVDLTFDAVVEAPPGDYANTAQIAASDQYDPDSEPNNDDGDQSEDDEAGAVVVPAIIGLAKNVAGVINNGDGTYRVSYLLTFENLGGVTISDLELVDDVTAQMVPLSPTGFVAGDGTYAADPGWDGTGTSNILATGQSIDPGETGTVLISFIVTPGAEVGPHDNTASIVGSTPTGGTVADDSTDGIDVDADGDDTDGTRDDDDIPDEDDPTPVSFNEAPAVGLAKIVSAAPTSNDDGSYNLSYRLIVQNFGDVDLVDLQAVDDLFLTFSAVEAWTFVDATSTGLTVSPTYDGVTDTDLLTGADILPVGVTASIEITVRVSPGSELGPHWNTATIQGTSPADITVADVSQDGADPDPDGNGDPADNSDPTPVVFPDLGNVAGTVWEDANADADQGDAEIGLAGISVSLIDPGPDGIVGTADDIVVQTASTASDGSYVFTGVPAGDYVVLVDSGTLPELMQATFDPDGVLDHMTPVTVVSGETSGGNDFGYVPGFNLWLTKTSAGGGQIGERVDYTITVGNDGPGTALGPIIVTDTVPAAMPVTGVTGHGWDCSVLDQTVECILDGDLPADTEAAIVISTVVSGSASGDITNSADVESDGPVAEPDITDNVDVDTISVGELPRTGGDLLRFAVYGLLLLLAGAALVMSGRRASHSRR